MNMEYVKFGDGPRNMVILPGISLRPVTGSPQAIIQAYEVFSKDFTVYLFDYPESPKEDLRIDDLAEDIANGLKELELSEIYLYGVSMGGMVAQKLCILHPEMVKKMVLTSTVCKVEDHQKMDVWYDLAKDRDIMGLVSTFMKDVYSKEIYDQMINVTFSMFKDLSSEELRDFMIRLQAAKGFDTSEELYKVKVPVLVLGSLKDRIFSFEEMNRIVEILHCDSYFYEGYSHAVYDEAQDIKDRILEFFMR